MKKLFFLSAFALATIACSDKLTNSKAEKIAEQCIEAGTMNKETYPIQTKNVTLGEDSLKYKNLAKDGYLTLNKLPRTIYYRYDKYDISLTEKAKPFIEETKESSAILKTNDLELEKVIQVIEMPALGGAEVKLELKKTNKTPFSVFAKDNSEFKIKNVLFAKTADGWQWCQKNN